MKRVYTLFKKNTLMKFLLQQKQIADLEMELDGLQNELNMFGVSCIDMFVLYTCIYLYIFDERKYFNIFLISYV